ncbi:MAG: hypothetical protein JSU06_07470 [Actinobacteria bacterium]|nr:hypothetical protein [Actinomycetota bacterium]
MSRAYYGAFNKSRRWLEANVTPIDDRRAHEQVWETFKTADLASAGTRREWLLVGGLGDSLRRLRNQADYDDQVELAGGVERAVASAERIVRLLDRLELAH